MSHPFRTEFRHATPADIARCNAEQERRGDAAYRDVLAELTQIVERTGEGESEMEFERWASHPDERVPAALIGQGGQHLELSWHVRRLLLDRAWTDAQDEGVLWTPLLDMLSSHAVWPQARVSMPGFSLPKSDYEYRVGLMTVDDALEAFAPWLAEDASAQDVRALLRFRDSRLWPVLARHARELDDEMFRIVLEHGSTVKEAVNNERLVRERFPGFMDFMEARLTDEDVSISAVEQERVLAELIDTAGGERFSRDIEPRLLQLAAGSRYRSVAKNLLTEDERTTTDTLRQMLEDTRYESEALPILKHPHATPALWCEYFQREDTGDMAVRCAKNSLTSEDRLDAVLEARPEDRNVVEALVGNPSTSLATLEKITESVSIFSIRLAIAEREDARRHAPIRDDLARRTTSAQLLTVLADDPEVPGDAFRDIFRQLANADASAAAAVLGRRMKREPVRLPPSSLVPLLSSDDGAVREVGLRAMGTERTAETDRVRTRGR